MLDIIFLCVIGLSFGLLAGLVPGLHINTLLPMMLGLSLFFPDAQNLSIIIVSAAISQVLISFIPSIFLGAPEADNALSTLPAHRLLLEGRGAEAVRIVSVGFVLPIIISIIIVLTLSQTFSFIYDQTRPYMHLILAAIVMFMIYSEKSLRGIVSAFLIIVLSGLFGFIVLNSSIVSQQNVLFPALSGMFGLSTIMVSLFQKSSLPKQVDESEIRMRGRDIIKVVFLGSIAGLAVGFLPAVGTSQAAALFQSIGGLGDPRSFLMITSSINSANEIFSLNSLYFINNPRSGASVYIERIMGGINQDDLMLFLSIIMFVGGISSIACVWLSNMFLKIISRVSYTCLMVFVCIFISIMVGLMTGLSGLLVLTTSASIGVLCNYLSIKRSNCMGVLLIPSILFFLNLNPLIVSTLRL